jgi:predicted metal-dependent phosphoesterase TrpH
MIDLHTHSLFSDGTDRPEALAQAAAEAGLAALALTDHDTLDGLDRFMALQAAVPTELVPGIELSCQFLGRPLHLLGLLMDWRDPVLGARVADLRRKREGRNRDMVDRLRARGVAITWEAVAAEAPTDLVSRTHFARALVRMGAAGGHDDAFRRLIGDDAPCFVPVPELAPGEAGGVAVVAHPGRTFGRGFRWDRAMRDLKDQGVQGFEAWYPDYGPAEHAYFLALAEELDMVPTGGSDYHGGHKLGRALGMEVPDRVLERLRRLKG